MASAPEADLVDHLATEVTWLTENSTLFVGKMVPPDSYVPHRSAFVAPYGGGEPEAYMSTTSEVHTTSVQVINRGSERDYPQALADAREIRQAIHHADLTGYIDVKVLSSEPLPLGEDEEGHFLFANNVELMHERSRG